MSDDNITNFSDPLGMDALLSKQKLLMEYVPVREPSDTGLTTLKRIEASLGLIEETMEYLNSVGYKSWRPSPLTHGRQLEELVDILFFFLELVILSGFAWEEVVTEYDNKWEENMSRYANAWKGDYSWDQRATKQEL